MVQPLVQAYWAVEPAGEAVCPFGLRAGKRFDRVTRFRITGVGYGEE